MKKLISIILCGIMLLTCTACNDNYETTISGEEMAQSLNATFVKRSKSPFSAAPDDVKFHFTSNAMKFTITESQREDGLYIETNYYEVLLAAYKEDVTETLKTHQFTYKISRNEPKDVKESNFLYIQLMDTVNQGPHLKITAYTDDPENAVNAMFGIVTMLSMFLPNNPPEYFQPTWQVVQATEHGTISIYTGALYRVIEHE